MVSINLDTIILLLASVGGFASVLAFALPFLTRDKRAERVKLVAKRREELSREQRERLDQQQRPRRKTQAHISAMKEMLKRLNLEKLTAAPELKQALAAAGWRHPSAIVTFVFSRLAGAVALAAVAFFFATVQKKFALPLFGKALITAVAAAAGFYLPAMLVKNAAQKRQQEMTRSFPDALDLLVICVESGLSIEAAFNRVAEEMSETAPVLAQEFGLTTAELAYLGDRQKAYANFASRTGLPAAKSLATALAQADKYGTSVSVALKVLSQESRDDRMAKAEKKAGALPAQLTVPMILFFLPVLFMVIIGPAVIQIVNR